MKVFDHKEIKNLYTPNSNSNGEDNGQITIIGGSSLFKGAPIFSLKAASRIVDMVFFGSPEPAMEKVSAYIHAEVQSFIWVPFSEIGSYIEKSDAALIGPGFMRFKSEDSPRHIREDDCDDACLLTRNVSSDLLKKFSHKKWVIDGGSLQTIEPEWIPQNAVITPNKKEFQMLFGVKFTGEENYEELSEIVSEKAKEFKCVIVLKGPKTIVASEKEVCLVEGGNAGLTKGGTGDTQAGLTVALLAKNEPFLAAAAAAFIIKKSAEEIYTRVGTFFNSEDVAEEVPRVLASYTK